MRSRPMRASGEFVKWLSFRGFATSTLASGGEAVKMRQLEVMYGYYDPIG